MINVELLKKYISQMDIEINPYCYDRLDDYAERLIEWNKNVNLTAITQPDDVLVKHFVDCLYILKYVDINENARLIDVGTGAGFPGMPLLMARPNIKVTFLDSLNKRLNFINEVLNYNGLEATTTHLRAEDAGHSYDLRECFDIATARAVAPMNVLCEYCLPFVMVGGYFVAMKGPDNELSQCENAISLLGGEIQENISYKLPNGDDRSIIIVKKVSHTPTKYPRKSKKISSCPL